MYRNKRNSKEQSSNFKVGIAFGDEMEFKKAALDAFYDFIFSFKLCSLNFDICYTATAAFIPG